MWKGFVKGQVDYGIIRIWQNTEKSPGDLRLEETCCYLNLSEKPSANDGVKNSEKKIIIVVIIVAVIIIIIIIRALGIILYTCPTGIPREFETIQITTLLRTARKLRSLLK